MVIVNENVSEWSEIQTEKRNAQKHKSRRKNKIFLFTASFSQILKLKEFIQY